MVVAYDPNHVYYFQKLTTGPELIEQRFSDSWSGTSDRVSKIIRQGTKQTIFISTDFSENCRVLFCNGLFHLEGDKITVTEELHLDILQSLDTRIQ